MLKQWFVAQFATPYKASWRRVRRDWTRRGSRKRVTSAQPMAQPEMRRESDFMATGVPAG